MVCVLRSMVADFERLGTRLKIPDDIAIDGIKML